MFCIACGANIQADSKFCGKCGNRTEEQAGCASPEFQTLSPTGIVTQNATKKAAVNLTKTQIVSGLVFGAIGVWIAAGGMTAIGKHDAASNSVPEPSTPPSISNAQPTPVATPVRTYYTLSSNAPVCTSFKGAITAAAVMRSGNPMAIDAVLSRQGCETLPQATELDPGASIQDRTGGGRSDRHAEW